jgi:transposase InsO family protein
LAGFCNVSFVTDVCSPHPGLADVDVETTDLATAAPSQALSTRRRTDIHLAPTSLVHRSGAGSQCTSLALTGALLEAGIAGSIGTVGDALDNALVESTIELNKPNSSTATGASGPVEPRPSEGPRSGCIGTAPTARTPPGLPLAQRISNSATVRPPRTRAVA